MAKGGLTKKQVEHVAQLANLPLTTSEVKIFQEQLSEVVEYVGKISNIKNQTSKISEKEMPEKGREDIANAAKCLSQEDALAGTEGKHNGLFVVPAIFEES